MIMNKTICVFGSSSNTIQPVFFSAAEHLGREIALQGDTLLFGGGTTGLMGACARAVHAEKGKVVGVIPEALNVAGIAYDNCDELIVTRDLRDRAEYMDTRSDAFIALPGGFGTIEEVMEAITHKQLGYHSKPIVIMNVAGCYDPLLAQLDSLVRQNFAKPACMALFFVTDDAVKALRYISGYSPKEQERWLTDVETTPLSVRPDTGSEIPAFEYCKLEIYVPKTHLEPLREVLRGVDAGHIGNYDSCLSYYETTGCWRPLPGSSPFNGEEGVVSSAPELKVEVLCRLSKLDETIRAVKTVHPYEVPVINAIPLYRTGL
jgi:uncharacterized protein (TIGR00730 family)